MTEATWTDAEFDEATKFNILESPWYLNPRNPEVKARRDERTRIFHAELAAKAAPKRFSFKPAKSVSTMPKPEQDITKPVKVIDVLKATPKPSPAPRKGKLNGSAIIRVLVSEFGHKAGSKAETKSGALKDGMTVAEYMANDLGFAGKWHGSHIAHCISKSFIKLEDRT